MKESITEKIMEATKERITDEAFPKEHTLNPEKDWLFTEGWGELLDSEKTQRGLQNAFPSLPYLTRQRRNYWHEQ